MAATEQLRWRRAFPARAVRRLAWFLLAGVALVAVVWGLFGSEPDVLPSGRANPLAEIPAITMAATAALALPLLLIATRRPVVAADHYALRVRPGVLRTLVLPWALVTEISGRRVRGEPLLLVRCAGQGPHPGDRPRWCDQSLLRAARRRSADHRQVIDTYDLAVRMAEFAGAPAAQLAALAAWAPPHVAVTRSL